MIMSILGNGISSKSKRAFTLIELLVVIGLIAALAGGVGLALRGGNPSSAVRSAQGVMSSVLAAARGQAALNQTDAMIIVQADSAANNFLRSIKVVVEVTAGSNTWKEVGAEFLLAETAYVVPEASGLAGVTLAKSDTSRLSSFFESTGPVAGLTPVGSYLRSRKITPLGSVSSAGRMVIAAGQATSATAVTLDNDLNARGLAISKYGVASFVNDPESFD